MRRYYGHIDRRRHYLPAVCCELEQGLDVQARVWLSGRRGGELVAGESVSSILRKEPVNTAVQKCDEMLEVRHTLPPFQFPADGTLSTAPLLHDRNTGTEGDKTNAEADSPIAIQRSSIGVAT
jgi:hypothetical protein